jgi:hypothetical protein
MRLRFQADADLNQNILHTVIRREPTLDCQLEYSTIARTSPVWSDNSYLPLLASGWTASAQLLLCAPCIS